MTGAVVAFPLSRLPLVGHRTPVGVEVVLAPLADLWAAWVRIPAGRVLVLACTDDRERALADARSYADRFGIPLTILDAQLASETVAPARGGEVYIWPSPQEEGCWGVEHVSASGDSSALLARAFSFGEAVTIARIQAERLGAIFDEGDAPRGGTAA